MEDIGLRRPSLDDVFLRLTGHGTEERVEDRAADHAGTDHRYADHDHHGTENHDSAEVAAA